MLIKLPLPGTAGVVVFPPLTLELYERYTVRLAAKVILMPERHWWQNDIASQDFPSPAKNLLSTQLFNPFQELGTILVQI